MVLCYNICCYWFDFGVVFWHCHSSNRERNLSIQSKRAVMTIKQLWQSTPITLLLIVVFVAVMVIQWAMGVNIESPSALHLVQFGANFYGLTVLNEPWRLLTSGFVHIGVMHLLANAFSMYFLGQAGELIVGKWRMLAVFLFSVAGGNLLTLWTAWQTIENAPPPVTAGASGGILGIALVLFVLAISKAPTAVMLNFKGLLLIIVLNVVMGFAIDGINNAGHFGGMIVGAILGAVLSFELKNKRFGGAFWLISAVLCLIMGLIWWQLHTALLAIL